MGELYEYRDGLLYRGNCLKFMREQDDDSVDLIVGSPPYSAQRSYGINFNLRGQDWVDWMVEIFTEGVRVCKGAVCLVVGHGVQEKFQWDATPALLCADLHRAGICLRNPKWYYRHGTFGSGGKDDFQKKIEFIIVATSGGRLPWSDNTACGHPPKYKAGGATSHRNKDGSRTHRAYKPPKLSNPGDVIECGSVGGGHLGSELAHENEAPYPEKVPEFFIKSWCPPGGIVYDPFCGSGTTIAVAIKNGRQWWGSDLRKSQIDLTKRRIKEARSKMRLGITE